MQGKANFRGHPLHLILVSFPVAFWTGALFTDAMGAWRGDDFWFRMSVVLIAMGTAISVPASVCGYVDYLTVRLPRAGRNVANSHLIWSLAATAIFALALWLRAGASRAPWGIGLTVAGDCVLLVGAYLGSELANRYRVGIRETTPDRASAVSRARP